MVLGEVEPELAHVGARAVRIDTDQPGFGLAEPPAFVPEYLGGLSGVGQVHWLVEPGADGREHGCNGGRQTPSRASAHAPGHPVPNTAVRSNSRFSPNQLRDHD